MFFDDKSPEQEYLDELEEQDRLNMVLVEDLVPVWKVVFNRANADQIERLLGLTDESLKCYWGPDSKVTYDHDAGVLRLQHVDGRDFERFIAF